MCFLVARRKAAELSEAEFRVEHQKLTTRLRAWRDTLYPRLTDPANLVTPFHNLFWAEDMLLLPLFQRDPTWWRWIAELLIA